jgi:hypothetical protein
MIKEFLSFFDSEINQISDSNTKFKLFKRLFIDECKYNLDLLNIINFSKVKSDDEQLGKLIQLLSQSALELIIFDVYKSKSESYIFNMFNELLQNEKIKIGGESILEHIKSSDSIIFNLYKRISVLKAVAKIDTSSESFKNLNYRTRLKNLRALLLDIINNIEY